MRGPVGRWLSPCRVAFVALFLATACRAALPNSPIAEIGVAANLTCARTLDRRVFCWGRNAQGELSGYPSRDRRAPIEISLPPVATLALGSTKICVVLSDGGLMCWGTTHASGWTLLDARPPAAIPGLQPITSAALGDHFGCGVERGGLVRCFDDDPFPESSWSGAMPPIVLPTSARAISVGGKHGCVLGNDGTVACWGDNTLGESGQPPQIDTRQPRTVSDLNHVVQVAAGSQYTCARTSDGLVRCWGSNYFGQLGDGSTAGHYTPRPVLGLRQAIGVAVGDAHSCAWTRDGSGWCWGFNSEGQLGNGTRRDSPVPVRVPLAAPVQQMAVSGNGAFSHSCALVADGAIYCWGYNDSGQLGDGTRVSRLSPTRVRW